MNQKSVRQIKSQSNLGVPIKNKKPKTSTTAQQQFIGAALNMSWQLALAVLVPVIGGVKLDQNFNTTPLLTIIGFMLAIFGMVIVVWRQFQALSPTNHEKGSSV